MQNILDFIVPLFVLISVIVGMINSVKQAAARNVAAPQPPPMTPAQENMGRFLEGLPPEDRQQVSAQRPQNQPNQGSRPQQRPKPSTPLSVTTSAATWGGTSTTSLKKISTNESGVILDLNRASLWKCPPRTPVPRRPTKFCQSSKLEPACAMPFWSTKSSRVLDR